MAKLKQIVLKVIFWIGVGIEILLVVQIYAFAKMGEYSEMLIIGSIATIPIIGFFIHSSMEEKRKRDAEKKRIKFLRNKGIALKVLFSECQINANERTVYYDRQDIPAYSMQDRLHSPRSLYEPDIPEQSLRSQRMNAWNAMTNSEQMNERLSYERCICTVSSTLNYKGKQKIFISEPIFMDKISLDIYLALHEEGVIYVNPNDDNDYFFDLEFLKQEGTPFGHPLLL